MRVLRYVFSLAILAVSTLFVLAEKTAAQPLILKQTYLNPNLAANGAFGASLAGLGTNVLIGAPFANAGAGAVYLFDGNKGSFIRHFLNPSPNSGDQFGVSVAVVGNNVLIGAPFDDNGGATDAGAAYLFDGTNGDLLRTWLDPTPNVGNPSGDQFGHSVAGVGNNALIGAPFDDVGPTDDNNGVAYLFNGNSAVPLQTFLNQSPTSNERFGFAVAGVGSNALVGAPGDNGNTGAAYLLDGVTGDVLLTIANPTTPLAGDQFGAAVAAVGNDLLVAAPMDNTVATGAGASYLFSGSSGSLLRTFTNPGTVPISGDQFGFAVAAIGASVVTLAGAPFDDTGFSDSGAAYMFDGTTGTIGTLLQTFSNPDADPTDRFGYAIAAVGKKVIVGAPNHDEPGVNNTGAVYLFGTPNEPPLANAGVDQNLECSSPSGTPVTLDGSASTDPDLDPLTYTWSKNGVIMTNSSSLVATLAVGSHMFELTVDDGNGETDTDEVVITIVDTTPPTITPIGANPMTIECHVGSYTELGATISDLCDPNQVPAISGTVDANTVGTYTITYTVSENNASATRTVNVVDTKPPVITLNGDNSMTLECHTGSYTELGATASDLCNPGPIPVARTGEIDVNVVGVYTITYAASDVNGNSSSATRTVNVVDTTPPVITLNGDNSMALECHVGSYIEPGATASDLCNPGPITVTPSGNVDVHVVGTYTITYTAKDESGNEATPATRTVIVECPLPHPYVLLAGKKITIDHQLYSKGDIHSNDDIEFRNGNPSTHAGNLTAVDDITIKKYNTIDGNVTAGGYVARESNVTITGTVTSNAAVDHYPLPTFAFTSGTQNVTVNQSQSRSLAPGAYRDVTVGNAGNLSLYNNGTTGEYFIYELDLDRFAKLFINVSSGPVVINLVRQFHFEKDVKVVITPAVESSSRIVTFNVKGGDDQHVHERANVSGNINAPNAEVILKSGSFFKGAVAAKYITVESNATVLHHNSTSSMSSKVATTAAGDAEESEAEESLESEENPAAVVTSYALEQNYPNPFNPETEIGFALPEAGRVTVKIFNMLGEEIRRLVDGDYAVGQHTVRWNGQNDGGEKVPSGVYFYQMTTSSFRETKKMLMAK